jgi:hypothetical protein
LPEIVLILSVLSLESPFRVFYRDIFGFFPAYTEFYQSQLRMQLTDACFSLALPAVSIYYAFYENREHE